MRLRQLATTQSLVFFAFPETHESILDVCEMSTDDTIDSSHVVRWLLEQTCRANEQLQPLYTAQGLDFCNRTSAEWENADFLSNIRLRRAYVEVLRHKEQQSLEDMYGPHTMDTQDITDFHIEHPRIGAFRANLTNIRNANRSINTAVNPSALEEVEQEREVEFEVEEVREVQKPTHFKALTFPGLHDDISTFVDSGVLSGGTGYEHVYTAIARTSVGQIFGTKRTASRLFASAQFMRTIDARKDRETHNFVVCCFETPPPNSPLTSYSSARLNTFCTAPVLARRLYLSLRKLRFSYQSFASENRVPRSIFSHTRLLSRRRCCISTIWNTTHCQPFQRIVTFLPGSESNWASSLVGCT